MAAPSGRHDDGDDDDIDMMMVMMMTVLLLQGMVEKWLLQVEDMMISSVRKVVMDSIQAYKDTPRKRWVIDWPGQVILCVSSIYWTSEVIEAMTQQDGLQVCDAVYSVCGFVGGIALSAYLLVYLMDWLSLILLLTGFKNMNRFLCRQ